MASRFEEARQKRDAELFKGVERPKEIKALYYWNWLRDDLDRPDDIAIIVKPIEASTPMLEELPAGFYPDDKSHKEGAFAFSDNRNLASEMLDRDRRFVYNTSIGGIAAYERGSY